MEDCAKINGTYAFIDKIPIKEVKVGKVYYIDKHHHRIFNYDITIEDERVKCIYNETSFGKHQIWLQLEKYYEELNGEWKNSLIFTFPDDDYYNDFMLYKGVKVK